MGHRGTKDTLNLTYTYDFAVPSDKMIINQELIYNHLRNGLAWKM